MIHLGLVLIVVVYAAAVRVHFPRPDLGVLAT
jgi:hypothetical protein